MMKKNIFVLIVSVIAAYWIGVESAKSRGKDYEDLRHQVERLWFSPDAKKTRRRLAKKAEKSVKKAGKQLRGR
jgi:hypothetical protein